MQVISMNIVACLLDLMTVTVTVTVCLLFLLFLLQVSVTVSRDQSMKGTYQKNEYTTVFLLELMTETETGTEIVFHLESKNVYLLLLPESTIASRPRLVPHTAQTTGMKLSLPSQYRWSVIRAGTTRIVRK